MTKNLSNNLKEETLIHHIIELRRRVIYIFLFFIVAFGVAFYYHDIILEFILRPLIRQKDFTDNNKVIATALYEPFVISIKLSAWVGLMVSMPIICFQVWFFVAPGLYKNEKILFIPFLISIPLFFFGGALMAYFIVFPKAWKFFLHFQEGTSIEIQAHIAQYLSLSMSLVFAFGLCFEIPVILLLLTRVRVIKTEQLIKWRKFAIVIAFVLSAVLTPPDIFSQLLLALPLIVLYEVTIILSKLFDKSAKDL